MDQLRRLYVRVSERPRGQTMSEYALIIAVLGIVVFGSLKTIGNHVHALVNGAVALL
ncbi:MAG: Flp family type IVb pilin [Candidatus Binataceae bacterium]